MMERKKARREGVSGAKVHASSTDGSFIVVADNMGNTDSISYMGSGNQQLCRTVSLSLSTLPCHCGLPMGQGRSNWASSPL